MFSQLLVDQITGEELMDINIEQVGGIHLVAMSGRFDTTSATAAQELILPLASNGSKILLDMTDVTYMSSAGLRILLMLYRTITEHVGDIVLAGMSEELIDVMAITGFLEFFTTAETRELGLAALNKLKQ